MSAAAQVGTLRDKRLAVLEFDAPWKARCDALTAAKNLAELERDDRCKAITVLSDAARTAATDQASAAKMTLFTRANTLAILTEQEICDAEEGNCALSAGRSLGVHYLMVGKVTELEGTFIVDLQLYDVKTGAVLPGASQVEGKGLLEASRSVRELVPRLLERGLGIRPQSSVGAVPLGPSGYAAPVAGGRGSLIIKTEPPGADCVLDGRNVGASPVNLASVPAGPHHLALTLESCEPYQEVVAVEPDRETTRELSLSCQAVAVKLEIEPRGAEVRIDGQSVGDSRTLELPPGDHRIAVSKAGYAPWERSFTVRPREPARLAASLAVLPIQVTFSVAPADARLLLNGKLVQPGRALALAPGAYVVAASRADYVDEEQKLDLAIAQPALTFKMALDRKPTLTIASIPTGAALRLDGRAAGKTDTSMIVEPGKHELELELAGFENARKALTLAAGSDETLRIALTKGLSAPEQRARVMTKRWAWGMTAVAAVGLGVFAVKGLEARSLDAKKADLPAGTAAAKSNAAELESAAKVADAGLVTAVVAAIPAGFLWWRVAF